MAAPAGLEPASSRLEGGRPFQLGLGAIGDPGRTRTCILRLRRSALIRLSYGIVLLTPPVPANQGAAGMGEVNPKDRGRVGGADGIRTRVYRIESPASWTARRRLHVGSGCRNRTHVCRVKAGGSTIELTRHFWQPVRDSNPRLLGQNQVLCH